MTDTEIELAKTQYYRVLRVITHYDKADRWVARVRVRRTDTDEYVNLGFMVSGSDKRTVETESADKIRDSLMAQLDEQVPTEWNSDVRRLLVRCTRLRNKFTKFGAFCSKQITDSDNDDEFYDKYIIFWNMVINESTAISHQIELLGAKDRLALLQSPDSVFEDPSDAWSLLDLDRRDQVYSFFLDPTAAEQQAHEAQLRRLSDRFNELGWDEM